MERKKHFRLNRAERKIYEIFGVKLFRSLVFRLERFLHRKDRSRNINYHIATYEPTEISAFMKYLFYNGTIHVRNAIFIFLCLSVHFALTHRFGWYNVLPFLFMIKDLYCIMLQRYNYLRITERQARLEEKQNAKIERKAAQIISSGLPNYEQKYAAEDLAFVRKLSECIKNRESIILSESEQQSLLRIKEIMSATKG